MKAPGALLLLTLAIWCFSDTAGASLREDFIASLKDVVMSIRRCKSDMHAGLAASFRDIENNIIKTENGKN